MKREEVEPAADRYAETSQDTALECSGWTVQVRCRNAFLAGAEYAQSGDNDAHYYEKGYRSGYNDGRNEAIKQVALEIVTAARALLEVKDEPLNIPSKG